MQGKDEVTLRVSYWFHWAALLITYWSFSYNIFSPLPPSQSCGPGRISNKLLSTFNWQNVSNEKKKSIGFQHPAKNKTVDFSQSFKRLGVLKAKNKKNFMNIFSQSLTLKSPLGSNTPEDKAAHLHSFSSVLRIALEVVARTIRQEEERTLKYVSICSCLQLTWDTLYIDGTFYKICFKRNSAKL